MTERPPNQDFGKRRPVTTEPAQPLKRSNHVALLLMGTLAVGGAAYVLTPKCETTSPGMAAPALAQDNAACTSHGGGGGAGRSSRFSFFGNSDSTGHSSATESTGVTRGGFGSVGAAFGFPGGG